MLTNTANMKVNTLFPYSVVFCVSSFEKEQKETHILALAWLAWSREQSVTGCEIVSVIVANLKNKKCNHF